MRLPNFLIIGARKSGTTTLYEYLCRHPQIFMTTPKEPGFFVMTNKQEKVRFWSKWSDNKISYSLSPSPVYKRGLDWYSSLFKDALPHQVCGESTTIYTQYPFFQSAELIAKYLPEVKFIYLMRHPVERAYSHYAYHMKIAQYNMNKLRKNFSFEESFERYNGVLNTSNYIQQIEQYLKYYSKESFCFILMEDLINQTAETLRTVCKFLGVDENINLIQDEQIISNKNSTLDEKLFQIYIQSFKGIPGVSMTTTLLSEELQYRAKEKLRKRFEQKYLPRPMLPETRQMLLEKFREPNEKLAIFLNRDLSHWSK